MAATRTEEGHARPGLNYSRESWPLRADLCPCDLDLVDYLAARRVGGAAVFHFGTGEHHVLGLENAKRRRPNHILGVTASPQEHARYVELVIADPSLANTYKAMFADIYTLDPRLLPRFDIVALFHLCEFYDPARSGYAPLDDRKLLELFLDRLRPGGRICFYLASNGRDAMLDLVGAFAGAGKLAVAEIFRKLLVCAKPKRRPGAAARARDRALIRRIRDA